MAASVIWPPKEVFLVLTVIKLARANKEIAEIINATKISINVNPFDLINKFKTPPRLKESFL